MEEVHYYLTTFLLGTNSIPWTHPSTFPFHIYRYHPIINKRNSFSFQIDFQKVKSQMKIISGTKILSGSSKGHKLRVTYVSSLWPCNMHLFTTPSTKEIVLDNQRVLFARKWTEMKQSYSFLTKANFGKGRKWKCYCFHSVYIPPFFGAKNNKAIIEAMDFIFLRS